MSDIEFGDSTPDDAYSAGDEDVNWDQVERVASQIESINAIDNPHERLEAAKTWAKELAGET
ncbi:MAG: hypothetical protein ABWY25_06420 [Paenisporosarcina sp.]